MSKKTEVIGIRISRELKEQLVKVSEKVDAPASWCIREAIKQFIKNNK